MRRYDEQITAMNWSSGHNFSLVLDTDPNFIYYTLSMKTEEMVAELFEIFDTNDDGVISRGEFVSLAECLLHQKGYKFSSDLFKQFDANHDNKISKDELVTMIIDLAL